MILLIEKTAEAAAQRAADHVVSVVSGTSRFRLGAAAGRTFEPVYAKLAAFWADLLSLQIIQLEEYIGIHRGHPASFLRRHPAVTLVADGAAASALSAAWVTA